MMNGSASLSITDANVVLEGGLPKGAKGSWLVTGRRTYYDLVIQVSIVRPGPITGGMVHPYLQLVGKF